MTPLPVILDVIDGLDLLICGLDREGTIVAFNRPCEELTGVPRDAAVGASWLGFFASDERHDHVLSLWDEAHRGERVRPYDALCRNGRSVRWRFARSSVLFAEPIQLWAVGIDITDEREAAARSREHERIASLGSLVAGLTHELRNPLNGALLQLALAARHERNAHGTTTPTAVAINHATVDIRRISTLLDDFLVFVRPLPMNLERVDVRLLVERAIDRARTKAVAAGVSMLFDADDKASAEVDASRIATAVYHLLANAIDAAAEVADREVRVRLEVHENTIAIEIEDHGAGVPANGAAPIFEPFFTTKPGGTGLGLAIVSRVAADHAGTISYRRADAATVFRLAFPIVGGARNEPEGD